MVSHAELLTTLSRANDVFCKNIRHCTRFFAMVKRALFPNPQSKTRFGVWDEVGMAIKVTRTSFNKNHCNVI